MHAPDYPIVTERLLIRPLDAAADVDAVHAYQSIPEVVRYIPYGARSRDEVAEVLSSPRNRSVLEAAGTALTLAIVRRDTGDLVGDVMLAWTSEQDRSGEIGYVLHPDHHGHGFVTEACTALLDWAFDRDGLDLHRIVGRIDERNEASARTLRRLGMRQEARLVENAWFKGEWSTEIDFAVLAEEWRAARRG